MAGKRGRNDESLDGSAAAASPAAAAAAAATPEPLPAGLCAADVAAAIRVGAALSEAGLDAYQSTSLRELRQAWGPLVLMKAQKMYKTSREDKEDARKKREIRQKMHDRRLLETRRLRSQRIQQLAALQNSEGSSLAAIPDGAVDDGVNTSLGQGGGAGDVPVILLCDKDNQHEQEGENGSNGASAVASHAAAAAADDAELLHRPRSCYACKRRFFRLHHFYDQFCETCAALNWKKRMQTCDLSGTTALLTGGRVKIGYQVGLKLLRMGARVIVTTRFTADAALRYAKEPDFASFKDRLRICGVDFRDISAVERFAEHLAGSLDRLDVIINNACQTIRRPPAYYRHLLKAEQELPRLEGAHFAAARGVVDSTAWHGGAATAAQEKQTRAVQDSDVFAAATLAPAAAAVTERSNTKTSSSAALSQVQVSAEDADAEAQADELFPAGQLDVNAQQMDLRARNSWLLTLAEVPTAETVEVLAVNTVAPSIFNAKLKALMLRTRAQDEAAGSPDRGRYIVNVSAMEGKFYRRKADTHPHTNMAKAALNMMTRTSGGEYARGGIFMTSVDTGWINDENPLQEAARIAKQNNFQTPIDEVDAAARVLDPVVTGASGGERLHSCFLKDYRQSE